MNLLDKLALPRIKDVIVEDFNHSKRIYNEIYSKNQTKKQKEILVFIFDTFSDYFNLGYETKLKFDDENCNDETIYIDNIMNVDFDTAFYLIYIECLKKYFNNIYKLKNNEIDKDIYKVIRLAVLNNDEVIVKKLADNLYFDILDERFDIINHCIKQEITKSNRCSANRFYLSCNRNRCVFEINLN